MEVVEKGKTISVHGAEKVPVKKILLDAVILLILIWGVFAALLLFSSQPGWGLLPYFIAITLLLTVPLVSGVLIRQSRYHRNIFFDGEEKVLTLRGIWRAWQISFDEIREFQVKKYRLKRDVFLYRLDVRLASGKIRRLIQDVPDKGVLSSLGEKIGRLVGKPLNVCD